MRVSGICRRRHRFAYIAAWAAISLPANATEILRRVINRYNGEVNGYFLCDRGRFGYGFVDSPERIRTPRINSQTAVTADAAQSHFRKLLKAAKSAIGIGSPRASLEANFALRTLVGEENFFLGLNDTEHTLLNTIVELMRNGGIHSPSLREVEQADAVLILGEDVTHSAPRLALSLRQSVRNATFDLARTLHIAALAGCSSEGTRETGLKSRFYCQYLRHSPG